jgi:hypothetical protein
MAINMDVFLPRNIIKAASWLGKKPWVKFSHQDSWSANTDKSIWQNRTVQDLRMHRDEEFWQQVHGFLFRPYSSDKELVCDYAMTRAVAFGPKMFRPTSMQCQALENTDVDIPFSDYCQPFESLIVDFPEDYRQLKVSQGLVRCPRYVMSWFDKDLKLGMVACQFENQNDRIVQFITDLPEFKTIEEMISNSIRLEGDGRPAEDQADFDIAVLFQRLSINLNLIMMYAGGKLITQHLNREKWKHYRELKRRYEKERNHTALARLREGTIGEIDEVVYEKDREVDFYAVATENEAPDTEEPQTGLRASPEPHWRRGHWRNQQYGPRYAPAWKRILIKPKYVMGKKGRVVSSEEIDVADTQTTYNQKGDEYRPPTVQ